MIAVISSFVSDGGDQVGEDTSVHRDGKNADQDVGKSIIPRIVVSAVNKDQHQRYKPDQHRPEADDGKDFSGLPARRGSAIVCCPGVLFDVNVVAKVA